ncbi:MAG: T9SS type A sorting domain-containing protein [Bacteroidetes bacterium]|nr:T9SS type A sorting domain-containing protein [Bacteroidota bacterium]
MKKVNLKSIILMSLLGIFGQLKAQDFSALQQSIKFWTGTGSDSGAVIVTFPGNGLSDSSFVWGILFDDSISGGDALQKMAQADMNFSFLNQGGFLDSVSYNQYEGVNGVNNFWWNTFSFENGNWEYNSGLSAFIKKNNVYGISYTDSDPNTWEPMRYPTANPAPALNPEAVSIADFDNNNWRWFGEGNSKALLVVDFNPVNGGKSFVFGVRFDDSTTGLGLLEAISAEDSFFKINAGSFLNDIIYHSDSGIGGSPNYWGTWSATNFGNWSMNAGISEKIVDGAFFGCSYTDFSPALRPNYPQVVEAPLVDDDNNAVVYTNAESSVLVYPNPFAEKITFETEEVLSINIFSIEGKTIASENISGTKEILTKDWKSGVYFVNINSPQGSSVIRIIKQ